MRTAPRSEPSRRTRQRDAGPALLFMLPAALFMAFVFFYPIGSVVWTSFQDPFTEEFAGLANYRALFNDSIFHAAVINNLKLFVVLPFLVVTSLLIAQVLHDQIRGWRIYRAIIFMPYVVPVVVAAMVFGQILQRYGLVNSMLEAVGLGGLAQNWLGDPKTAVWSLAGVVQWRELAFGVILFLARMTQLPVDLYDAARVDGANWLQRLRHVTVPQMATMIAFYTGIIVVALFNWVFNYVFVLTKGGPGTSTYVMEYYIYSRAFIYGDFGNAAALSTLMLAAILAFMVVFLTWLHRRGTL
ncbi:sugar ABC transporter permease [Knoellia locipacati]|uniref:carbohydrate ABC transporter permease n=1 Tax=Knoellia locipacati TaxID=882824 RepID=UPI00384E9E70